MSSLAAARADNFYYPPDFDPKKHQTLNKYNGQHPLRERAAKLDQGILVIRFEIPFNIWCDKCGEHIAKGERFNAEKKAIGHYHSTKVLQFCMTHHCGCRITIQTDPKNAEYLVVEGARKKEESYSAADAEVIELPDEEERERRRRDPLYRLEYQQDAKAKALSGAARLAAIQDMADARAADPYTLNRALRASLRGEKRTAAALESQRVALGLPGVVQLLPGAEADGLAAQVAFLTSSARAEAGAEAKRKRILEQDIFLGAAAGAGCAGIASAGGAAIASGAGAAAAAVAAVGGIGGRGMAPAVAAAVVKRQVATAAAGAAVKVRAVEAGRLPLEAARAGSATGGRGEAAGSGSDRGGCGGGAQEPASSGNRKAGVPCAAATAGTPAAAGGGAANGASRGAGVSDAAAGAGAPSGSSSSRMPPGAAALAAAAARKSASAQHRSGGAARPTGHTGTAAGLGNGLVGVAAAGGGGGGGVKRSLKDRAAELQRRRLGPSGVGLTTSRPDM
ncbi:hypothetical protein Agub_g11526 [Astrephomene gubernaculifera]|uniref:Coiled-coil domain-containing protein 130 n=1 Tax=Astrephomene gubernaculifera TaxID=47775 RepID=A0AAD3DWR5_9CHLO|nr:hypothetical protein Agub_g11526 [Astrephomene gubernaculifera]